MSSLTQLLTSHDRLLVLDAASQIMQVGLLRAGSRNIWHSATEEAGTGIFVQTDAVLKEAGLKISDIGAFLFCEGPGSMLGARTVAMALRTWQILSPRPIYSYQSLPVAGLFELRHKAPRDFTVIADARRNTWHCQPVAASGRMPPMQCMPVSALPAGDLVTPEKFRAWTQPSRPAEICSYDLALIFPVIADGDCFHRVELPDAFQHAAPEYKKWSAQIHSTLTADKK